MTTRQERVEALIQQEVSDILRRKVADPRIGFVSVTEVKISPDLKNASVFISVLGEEKSKEETMQGLYSATHFVQGELGQRLGLRTTPQIRFLRDDSLERGSRVLAIMHRIENEKHIRKHKKAIKRK